jgi:hypothetical protein
VRYVLRRGGSVRTVRLEEGGEGGLVINGEGVGQISPDPGLHKV